MKFLTLMVVVLCSVVTLRATEETKPAVTELDVKALQLNIDTQTIRGGRPTAGVKCSSLKELEKVLGKENAEKVAKKVNFAHENVLLVLWAGSGQDRVEFRSVKENTAMFSYTRGFTKDLRFHVRLFVLSKKLDYKIE